MATFANYTFKTEDTSTERREINSIAQQYGGFYVGMNEDGQLVFEFQKGTGRDRLRSRMV